MPQVIPIKDLKNASDISDLCHAPQESVFITKNGRDDVVIMNMEAYENMAWKSSLYRGPEVSEERIHPGRTKDVRASLDELKDKHGLQTTHYRTGGWATGLDHQLPYSQFKESYHCLQVLT